MGIMKFKVYNEHINHSIAPVGTSYFCEERGYEAIEVGKVVMLEIGESIRLENDHEVVTRIG